jgi:hypothetical protein
VSLLSHINALIFGTTQKPNNQLLHVHQWKTQTPN